LTRTSTPTKSTAEPSGFTLVELLVVIALIALIGGFALPSVTSAFRLSLNSATREIASIVKETYNSAAMTGKVHRMVFDIKENQYWVEVGPSNVLLHTTESKEREERMNRFSRPDDRPKAPSFALASGVTRKKKSLPRGVEFEDVITEQSPEPITEGLAYAHFFPHGISERAQVHLKDGSKHQITLVFSALLGRTRLIERYVKGEEAEGE
jgi:general secretion pathway protein H